MKVYYILGHNGIFYRSLVCHMYERGMISIAIILLPSTQQYATCTSNALFFLFSWLRTPQRKEGWVGVDVRSGWRFMSLWWLLRRADHVGAPPTAAASRKCEQGVEWDYCCSTSCIITKLGTLRTNSVFSRLKVLREVQRSSTKLRRVYSSCVPGTLSISYLVVEQYFSVVVGAPLSYLLVLRTTAASVNSAYCQVYDQQQIQ